MKTSHFLIILSLIFNLLGFGFLPASDVLTKVLTKTDHFYKPMSGLQYHLCVRAPFWSYPLSEDPFLL
jgi:hypothetical protein